MREQGGIERLLALLKKQGTSAKLAAAVLSAITVLTTESETNQEHVRQANGLSGIVKFLDARLGPETALAAVLCLTGAEPARQLTLKASHRTHLEKPAALSCRRVQNFAPRENLRSCNQQVHEEIPHHTSTFRRVYAHEGP